MIMIFINYKEKHGEDSFISVRLRKISGSIRYVGYWALGRSEKLRSAKQFIQDKKNIFFDLENPLDLARLENPMITLFAIQNQLIVIDEIQRKLLNYFQHYEF